MHDEHEYKEQLNAHALAHARIKSPAQPLRWVLVFGKSGCWKSCAFFPVLLTIFLLVNEEQRANQQLLVILELVVSTPKRVQLRSPPSIQPAQ